MSVGFGSSINVFIPDGVIDPSDPSADGRVIANISALGAPLPYPVQLVEATSIGEGSYPPGHGPPIGGDTATDWNNYWALDLKSLFTPDDAPGEVTIRLPLDNTADQHHFYVGQAGDKIAWLGESGGWEHEFPRPYIGMMTTFEALSDFAAQAMTFPPGNFATAHVATQYVKGPYDYIEAVEDASTHFAVPAGAEGYFGLLILDLTDQECVYYFDFMGRMQNGQKSYELVMLPVQQVGFIGGLSSTCTWLTQQGIWFFADNEERNAFNAKTLQFRQGHHYQVLIGTINPVFANEAMQSKGSLPSVDDAFVGPSFGSTVRTGHFDAEQAANLPDGGAGEGTYTITDYTVTLPAVTTGGTPHAAPDSLMLAIASQIEVYGVRSGFFANAWPGVVSETIVAPFDIFSDGNAAFYGAGGLGFLEGGAQLVLTKIGDPIYTIRALNYRVVLGSDPLATGGGGSASGNLVGSKKSARVNFERTSG